MEVENGPLKNHFPLQTGGFPLLCLWLETMSLTTDSGHGLTAFLTLRVEV